MQRQRTMCCHLAVLAVLASCGLDVPAAADAGKKEAPGPLPREIVKAWRGIGANVGWMKMDLGDNRPTFQVEGEIRALTVFQFTEWKEGVLAKMPDPGAPFGLCLNGTKMTDAGLKELAGLKSLQALDLGGTQVTDAGLKELAGLKSLRALDLRWTQVTDAGLKELAGLKSLQTLNLWITPGDGRGAEGTGRAEELANAEPWRHPGDGRGAEGAGRAEELAIADHVGHESDASRRCQAAKGVAKMQCR